MPLTLQQKSQFSHKANLLIEKLRELIGGSVMLRPSNQKGEVVIKTIFGDVVADTWDLSKSIEERMLS